MGNESTKKIVVCPDGPYRVEGDIPLVRKEQVVSEFGEPLTWKKVETIPTEGTYELCRCGHSTEMPFCSGAHNDFDFDGSEIADPRPTAERQVEIGGQGIHVRRDHSLCADAGFCANRITNIDRMAEQSTDPQVRAQVISMAGHCPSGSYVISLRQGETDFEPDLPQQIAVTTEITSSGPIDGPLWVTGKIPVERADGRPFEARNRVTLCSCGMSGNKPLCDGTHRMGR